MGFNIYKFRDIAEMRFHLNGGIFGGKPQSQFFIPVGSTLIFSQPTAATVTFAAGAGLPGILTYAEVKQQIEDAVTGLKVSSANDRLVLIEAAPTNGVIITGGTARQALGFDPGATTTGRVYSYVPAVAGGSPPYWVNAYFSDGHHTVVVME